MTTTASAWARGPRITRRAQARLGVLMVAPAAVLVVLFFVFPMLNAVYFSVVAFDGLTPNPPFVGLDNFARLFADPAVANGLGHNLLWVLIGTVSPIVLGFVLALLSWSVGRVGVLYRIAFFLPHLIPGVAIAIVWGWIYDPLSGWLNQLLRTVGLESLATGWLGDPRVALFAVLATAIWAHYGFVYVIFLAALRNVDVELLDAARIDGANAGQRAWFIVLPQILPVFLMVTTITLVGGFSVFDIVFVMTGGGPAGATDVLGTLAYTNAFELANVGYGTAIALSITVLSIPFVIVLNRVQRRMLEGQS